MSETNIRQAENRVNTIGLLSEKNLEIITDKGVEIIRGSITVQIDDLRTITFNVYTKAVTNSGGINPSFKSLKSFMLNEHSIAEVGKESASVVEITNATLEPNTYYTDGEENYNVRYRASFARGSQNPNPEFMAEFEVEGFIRSIVEETDKEGEETGRCIIKLWTPTYSILEPLNVVVGKEYAKDIINSYENGQTVKIYGDIINSRIVKTETVPVKIGKPITKTTTSYKNELVLTGITEPYEEERAYSAEVIKNAEQVRKEKLMEKKQQSMKQETKATVASGRNLPF